MKEEDIDKIFREGLQGSNAPVFDSDWENFQNLKNQKGSSGWKYLLPLLLAIAAVSGASYFYFSQPTVHIEGKSTVETKGNVTDNSSEISQTQEATTTLSAHSSSDISTNKDSAYVTKTDTQTDKSTTGENDETPERLSGSRNGKKPIIRSGNSEDVARKNTEGLSRNQELEQNEHVEIYPLANEREAARSEPSTTNPVDTKTSDKNTIEPNTESIELPPSQHKSPDVTNPPTSPGMRSVAEGSEMEVKNEASIVGYAFLPEHMTSLDASPLTISGDAKSFNAEQRTVLIAEDRHQISFYFGVEQNNILGTSPMLGVISTWNVEGWMFGIGLGYQRSGTLNWSQESTRTIYGFDRYEAVARLQTNSVDLISMPVKVSRHIGGAHALFLGVTPSLLVSARQELLIFDESNLTNFIPETGNLYKTEAPEIIYFISGGYTYYLSTWWTLDLGINYSFQNWRPTDKLPVGVFLQTNIRVR